MQPVVSKPNFFLFVSKDFSNEIHNYEVLFEDSSQPTEFGENSLEISESAIQIDESQ